MRLATPVGPGRTSDARFARVRAGMTRGVTIITVIATVTGCGWSAAAPPRSTAAEKPEYVGPQVITQDATVIDGMTILHPVVIQANNVVIRNSLITSATEEADDEPLVYVRPGAVGTILQGNEVRGPEPVAKGRASSGVKLYGNDIDFTNNRLSRIAGDGIVFHGTRIRLLNNRVTDFVYRAGVHYDALVYDGQEPQDDVLIKGNALELWVEGGMTTLISLPENAPKIEVSNNTLAGGAYALMGGGGGVRIVGNRFSTRFSRKCGLYGTHAHLGELYPGDITWSDNRWADGPQAGREIVR